MAAKIWQEPVSIPTYAVGERDRNQMFLEKRVYQGSSGRVYPWPVIDRIEQEKHDKAYQIVFLENDYIQVQVMPELGGRIYRAIDKTNGYDFVYWNRVKGVRHCNDYAIQSTRRGLQQRNTRMRD